ncbi:hypothetical protein KC19_12G124000 [Ceratodon purpureus]|uniref:Uncharacterized protein n=1 Tax=Ceratodon purpureus TaxID=3225 RepID=A0A8T0G739_CERPU|nr:hypothetical protein KC19_12G124000 [Ceratodon purpureus]
MNEQTEFLMLRIPGSGLKLQHARNREMQRSGGLKYQDFCVHMCVFILRICNFCKTCPHRMHSFPINIHSRTVVYPQ